MVEEKKGGQMIKLGDKVKEPITGFVGIVTVRTEYLLGETQVYVSPAELVDEKLPKGEWFNEKSLMGPRR